MKPTELKRLKKRLREAARAQQELERRMFHLKTLYDASREIGFLIDTQAIMKNLLMMVIGTFGTFRGVILLADTERGSVEALTQRGLDEQAMTTLADMVQSGRFTEDGVTASLNLQVWIPFSVKNQLTGGIGLGEKMTGEPYTLDDLELLTRPGHLPHSVIVRIPQAGAIFAGDNFVNGLYPWFQECIVLSWLETLKEIKQMDIDTIVPGHGDVCTKEAVAQLEGYINQVIEEVRTAIERGWPREETADRASFPPPWPVNSGLESRLPWAHRAGIMRIYDELKKGPEEPGQTNLLGRP